MSSTPIRLAYINRFPVKGLTAEPLGTVTLQPGEGIPGDRLFGFARYNSGFDPENPAPLPKDRFVVLAREAGLAGMRSAFDQITRLLSFDHQGRRHRFDMNTQAGREAAALFLREALSLSDPSPPVFVSSAPHRFTDVSVVSPRMMNAISVLNLASVRALEQTVQAAVDPARFRANLLIDGLPPYSEFEAIGSTLKFGAVTLRILSPTQRCAATEVNPVTAERDLNIPYLLRRELGHRNMGVYCEVLSGGSLETGQEGHQDV